jgi:DNA-binding IclR family transcriptional regulator
MLQAFTSQHPALTLTQLAENTDLNIVSPKRGTYTLMKLGFLKKNQHQEFCLNTQALYLIRKYWNKSMEFDRVQTYNGMSARCASQGSLWETNQG